MKKINRKGFTLVELLAVIIILAIVVGITIPAVLTTTQKAAQKAFQTAADTAADWFDREYQVFTTGLNTSGIATLDANFTATTSCGSDATKCTGASGATISDAKVIKAAGLKATNVSKMIVKIDATTGRTCVTLVATTTGDYNGAGTSKTVAEKDTIKSSGC